MTGKKQVKALQASVEREIAHWEKAVEQWDGADDTPYPTVGDKIESQLQQLAGMGQDTSAYDWALQM